MNLPQTHRTLLLTSRDQPPTITQQPTPQPTPGSITLRVLASGVVSYSSDVFTGRRPYPFPTPLIPGVSCIARVAATGPDTTSLKPNDLVFLDPTIHARDNPAYAMLIGLHAGYNDVSPQLMEGEWRNGTWAEYVRVPLENVCKLNEGRLLGELGYTVEQLDLISALVVPYGGLDDIGLKAGETIVIAPATGNFGGAAVTVALAMGARVVAMGRDAAKLEKLRERDPGRIQTVAVSGDVKKDTEAIKAAYGGEVDAYFDISPPQATQSTHFKSCIMALRHSGRVSLMGGVYGDVGLPLAWIMHNNITVRGTWMFTREQRERFVKMLEGGLLQLKDWEVKRFALEEWKEAWEFAEREGGTGKMAVFCP
ncbi:alcohol dehydrogenase [Mycena maculata]|uniref:Alcohol dehydrogenase n=1 Tax=Mycena maculata TaxID=230809 RepID=A0AAD7IU13_9AGAR|nr:alcohol dehydrogenase [Mycena maculata]